MHKSLHTNHRGYNNISHPRKSDIIVFTRRTTDCHACGNNDMGYIIPIYVYRYSDYICDTDLRLTPQL